MPDIAVGIDLGTSTSEVGYYNVTDDRVIFASFGEGGHVVPSVVWFDRNREQPVVGWQAYAMRVLENDEVVRNVKRHMGDPRWRWELDGKEYTPPQISGEILKYLKTEAERLAGEPVKRAVITVPAKFGTLDREHTQEAARIAGLETLMLLPEPVAAMVGYPGLRQDPNREYLAMVYDFGGGTFDCTIVRARGQEYQVLAKAGARDLGGALIDERIADRLIRPKVANAGLDWTSREPWAKLIEAKVLDASEAAKKSLSDEERKSVTVRLTNLEAPGKPKQSISVEISQEQLLDTIAPLLKAANEQMEIALDNAGLSREDLDMVILVGGSTRLRAIQDAVRDFMGEKSYDERGSGKGSHKVLADQNPDLLVARGAAIVAATHGSQQKQIQLVDILLDTVYMRVPGAVAQFQPLFAKGTDIESAKKEMMMGWPRGDTVAFDLYEGETDGKPGAKYLGTVKVGPASLQPRTEVVVKIEYRTDRALPEVTARVKNGGAPLKAAMVYEQDSVSATGNPQLHVPKELDLVFCVDTTGSMVNGGHLEKFRHVCSDFVRALEGTSMDIRLAAVSFGDRSGGEREVVYSFTPDRRLFLTRLSSLNENDGGDEPESSLDALDAALRLPLREGEATRHHVVLVTDAPPQAMEGGSLDRLLSGLAARNIRVDIAGPFHNNYDTVVAGTGGRLYDIDDGLHQLFADLGDVVRPAAGETEGR